MAPLPLASQRVVVTPSSAVTASPTQHFVRFEASPVTYTSAVPLTPAGVQMLHRNVFAFNEAEMRTYEGLIRSGFNRDQAHSIAAIERNGRLCQQVVRLVTTDQAVRLVGSIPPTGLEASPSVEYQGLAQYVAAKQPISRGPTPLLPAVETLADFTVDPLPKQRPPSLRQAKSSSISGGSGGDAPPTKEPFPPRRGRSTERRSRDSAAPARSSSRQSRAVSATSDNSYYNVADGLPFRQKDVFILRGGVRCARHRAREYQLTTTTAGWVRMSDFVNQIQREHSKNYRSDASFITSDFVAKLIIEADKPRLGVIHETSGYTWMRAWDKHEGWPIPIEAVEQRITSALELPSTAVFPCRWYTYAHHIKHEGIRGIEPRTLQRGGGDAPRTGVKEIRLLLGPCTAMRPSQPGIRRNSDTFLVVNLHGVFEQGFNVYLSAVPSKWITIILREQTTTGDSKCTIPVEHIVAVYSPESGYYDTPTHDKEDHTTLYYVNENSGLPSDYGQAPRVVEKAPNQTSDEALVAHFQDQILGRLRFVAGVYHGARPKY